MADEVDLTIVTLVFEASDPERLLPILSKYVVVSRGHPGCRNIDLAASATDGRPVRDHREVGVGRGPAGALRLARAWSRWPGAAPACSAHRPASTCSSASAPTTWPEPAGVRLARAGRRVSRRRTARRRRTGRRCRPRSGRRRSSSASKAASADVGEAVAVAEVVEPALALGRVARAGPGGPARRRPRPPGAGPSRASSGGGSPKAGSRRSRAWQDQPTDHHRHRSRCSSWRGWRGSSKAPPSTAITTGSTDSSVGPGQRVGLVHLDAHAPRRRAARPPRPPRRPPSTMASWSNITMRERSRA